MTTTVNINSMQDALVIIVTGIIGTQLATVKANNSGATRPAIVKSRTTANGSTNQPAIDLPYPYCVVDYNFTNYWGGGDIINEYLDVDGNSVYETDLIIEFSVEIVGRLANNVHTIANIFQRYVNTPNQRDKFESLMNSRLFKVSNIRKDVIKRSTEWVDMASLTLQVAVRDILTTDADGNIARIIVDGELLDSPDDLSPTLIHIDTNP